MNEILFSGLVGFVLVYLGLLVACLFGGFPEQNGIFQTLVLFAICFIVIVCGVYLEYGKKLKNK